VEHLMATLSANSNVPRSSSFNALDWIAWVLVVVGAINWGLVGAFNFNLVAALLGDMTTAARIVYGLVGLAGLYFISIPFRRSV
jgi:uncharacterized membrane protein YuzA (DUF378 family)